MKNCFRRILSPRLPLSSVWLAAVAQVVMAEIELENRAVSSGRNDVVYLAPATEPYEALPLGNGRLGVMVGNPRGVTYKFNHSSFFASADGNQMLWSSGEMDLELPDAWMDGFVEERLTLHDGAVATEFKTGKAGHRILSWVAEDMDVLVIQITSDVPLPDLKLNLSVWERSVPSELAAGKNQLSLTTVGLSKKRASSIVVQLLEGEGATAKTAARQVRLTPKADGRKAVTILVANPVTLGDAVTAEMAVNEARGLIDRARKVGEAALRRRHDDYWHSFWAKSGVLMHSEDGFADYLENLYHLHLYWMAGCSRGNDAPKFNGGNYLFYKDWRCWEGPYYYNNTREMYWSLDAANHPELFAPFIDLYWRNLPAAWKLAKELYDATGATYEEAMGRDGSGGKREDAHLCLYLTSGIEMAHQLYKHYQYTRDEAFLKEKVYPLLKETATFHLNFVTKGGDGRGHFYPSHTRETYHWVKDSVTDLAALRAVLPMLIEASAHLGVDEKERLQWRDVLAHLAPFVRDAAGQVILAGTLFDDFPPTRLSKIEAICPPAKRSTARVKNTFNCENVTIEPTYPWSLFGLHSEASELDLMRRTFRRRYTQGWTTGNDWDWTAPCAARLGMTEELLKSLRQFAENVQTYPSGLAGMAGTNPEQWGKVLSDTAGFDASGVPPTAIQEMQLQGYGGRIRVFPAWPQGWQGEFTLAAEGGFLVSAQINQDGTIPFIQIESRHAGPCAVVNPWKEGLTLKTKDGVKELGVGTLVTFPTVAGERYELCPKTPTPKAEAIAVTRCEGPKWPFHAGPRDTAEDYLKREDQSFGFLGITRDGQNPARNQVRRALNPGKYLGVEVQRPARPLVRISRTTQPPVIDGKLDDACWKDRKSIGPLIILGGQRAASNQTQVTICHDDQALYLAAVCQEPRMDRITAYVQEDPGNVSIFSQDSVEIYLQPSPPSYRHLAINAKGLRYDALVTGKEHDTAKRLDCQYVIETRPDAWVVELAIPFTALSAAPKPGDRWGFNFGRNHPRLKQISTWAPLSAFHQPEQFGQLAFGLARAEMQPVARFSFEGATAEEAARDAVAPSRRDRLVGDATLGPGKLGQALKLGGHGYLEVPHAPDLTLGDAITVEAWVYPLAKGARVIDKSTVGKPEEYNLDMYPENRIRWITPAATLSTADPVPLDTWTHLAATYDAEEGIQRIYVNGNLKAEQRGLNAARVGNTNPLRIGADSNAGSTFQGLIDEVRIYPCALPAEVIKAHAEGRCQNWNYFVKPN